MHSELDASAAHVAAIPAETCVICHGKLSLVCKSFPGYKQPDVYSILHCPTCDTSHAHPTRVDTAIYDRIYALKDRLPGYDRYQVYATDVLTKRDPLRYLADQEDVYWAVLTYLESRRSLSSAKIVEVGSGLGYLTYALVRRSLDVMGLDISASAVESAKSRYGDHFIHDDLHGFSANHSSMYDVAIMTEVIEHVADPLRFLDDAARLLKSGGEIVLTTPNKSMYDKAELWITEAPPIHLWWFSETSTEFIAKALGMDIKLLDFSEYSRRYAPLQTIKKPTPPGPILDERNNVCFREPLLNSTLRRLKLLNVAQRAVCRTVATIRGILPQSDGRSTAGRRGQMCAVLRKR